MPRQGESWRKSETLWFAGFVIAITTVAYIVGGGEASGYAAFISTILGAAIRFVKGKDKES